MGFARSSSVAVVGIEGHLVAVEVHLAQGTPSFTLVGLPDTALSEARDRVRAAVVTSVSGFPADRRLTVNLSPAGLRKSGTGYDLAIALAVLCAQGRLPQEALDGVVAVGELGLDGSLRAVPGVLPAALAAVAAGMPRLLVPAGNAGEARLVPGAQVRSAVHLRDAVALLRGEDVEEPDDAEPAPAEDVGAAAEPPDLRDVRGQPSARLALEIAAAGAHHVFLLGAPGAGKTMLAERLPGLLPPLSVAEALEVTAVHSVAGLLRSDARLVRRPPFQAPHHNASTVSIVGGGSGQVRPGAASLAHRGVLFLDEAPEFSPRALEALRQPLESGSILVSRAAGHVRFPARFQLVLAANPCPCGMAVGKGLQCTCTPLQQRRYLGRLSGPLLDRVDLRVEMLPPRRGSGRDTLEAVEPSAVVAARVVDARARACRRLARTGWSVNGEVPGPALRRLLPLPYDVVAPAEDLVRLGTLSLRGADRCLRIPWTLADLAGRDLPTRGDVALACDLRRGARAAA